MRFAQISRDLDAEIGDLLCFWVIFYICRICVKYPGPNCLGAQLNGGPSVRFFKGGHLGPEEGRKGNCCIIVFLYLESTPQMFSMNIRIE